MTSISPSTILRSLALALLSSCFAAAPNFPQPDSGRIDAGVMPTTDAGMNTTDGGLSPQDACPVLNERRCAYLARCGLIEATPTAKAECQRWLEVTWCGPLTWLPHVARNTLKYDAVRAYACAESFDSQACSEWTTLSDSCRRFLSPRVPLGGDCYDGFEECTDGVCRGSSCPRTCQPRALLDEVCTTDADCRTGLYCKLSPFMPSVGQCAAFGTMGAACESSSQCAEGLQCLQQQCRVLPAPGTPCLAGACSEAGYCDGSADGGVCIGRKSEGATCASDECMVGLVCDPLRDVCVKRDVSAGDECSLSQRCPAGTTCLGATRQATGTCLAPLDQREACVADADCQAHLACRDAGDGGQSCQLRATDGEACAGEQTCQSGAICLGGACTLLPLPGESCALTRACRWGLCRELVNSDGGAVCGALLSAGQPCQRNEECGSNACVMGSCVARCVP